jgi:hypothetical protein
LLLAKKLLALSLSTLRRFFASKLRFDLKTTRARDFASQNSHLLLKTTASLTSLMCRALPLILKEKRGQATCANFKKPFFSE